MVAAVAFSQVSSDRRVVQVALGIFTFLATFFSVISSASLIEIIKDAREEGLDEGDFSGYMRLVAQYSHVGAAFTLFGLSIFTVIRAARGPLEKLSSL